VQAEKSILSLGLIGIFSKYAEIIKNKEAFATNALVLKQTHERTVP